SLWDEQDGFFYDVLHTDGQHARIKVRSLVGLIPLLAVQAIEPEIVDKLPGFKRRMQWFIDNHPELSEHVEEMTQPNGCVRRLLSIVSREQLPRVLRIMIDEAEFLGPHGIRAVSRCHRDHPYVLRIDGMEHRIDYEPAESSSGLFGGNSNWRGPIWFPVNYLLIEALQKFHHFYGDALKVACPAGAGPMLNLWSVAGEISRRLTRIFLRDEDGRRPVYGGTEKFQRDPHWRDLILFYEYFHGDNGAGIGASPQTGWTGLVAKLLQQSGPYASACSMKLPGIYAVYAGVLKTFGETPAGIRLGLTLVTSASTVCVFLLGRRLLGPWPGVAAAATFAALTLSPALLGTAANAEHFAVLPGLIGLLLLLRAAPSGSRGVWLAADQAGQH